MTGKTDEVTLELEQLKTLEGSVLHKFKRGEIILRQGEPVNHIYYLVKGTCYRSAVTKQGDEVFYWIRSSEDDIDSLLGVFSLYGFGYCGSSITAKTECHCYRIPGDVFLKYADSNPLLLKMLLVRSLKQYGSLDKIFQSYREGGAARQVAGVLLDSSSDGKKGLLAGTCSYDAISRQTALHRVTVARVIRYFKENQIIGRQGRGMVILDREELKKIAEGKPVKYYNNRRERQQ